MIRLEGVAKRYAEKVVVAPTTLDVAARSVVALLGPSGSGKSTLLRIILGLVVPDEGRVVIDGTPVTPDTVTPIRHRIGYVIQDGGLFPHFTAFENVALQARYLGWDDARLGPRVEELAALVRLDARLLGRYPGELSGGQRQRVGIMRALVLDPPILLLDEPMGALDPMVRAGMQEDLKRIFTDLGKTVVLVTHSLDEAAFLSDEVVLMRDGAVVQRGPLRAIVGASADPFVRDFVDAQRASWR